MSDLWKRTVAFTRPQQEGLIRHMERLGLTSVSELVRRIVDKWLEDNHDKPE